MNIKNIMTDLLQLQSRNCVCQTKYMNYQDCNLLYKH